MNKGKTKSSKSSKEIFEVSEHIVEIASDSGEGAQTAGQLFGTISAKMGNGVWTVELIPAEIEPPARSKAGVSGNRIRLGSGPVTNAGNTADIVIGFNEQVLYSRIDQSAFRKGTIIFLENKWATDPVEETREAYAAALVDFEKHGYIVHEVPMEEECLKHVEDPRRGKNIWVVGLLCFIYQRDLELVKNEITKKLKKKGDAVVDYNLKLLQSGFDWAENNVSFQYKVAANPTDQKMVVMNGNQAVALGAMAAGMEMCSMYPITPATSVSHYLAAFFKNIGGFVHQAEDEIAAIGFAIGASYAGKTALTVTSGPGMCLKTEFIGLAVMAEIPLVIVNVQRGGPSTGLPTKVEQGDLLAALHSTTGDAPKIVVAPATIEECFHIMITARKLAEQYRIPVIVLTDANQATGVQPFARPEIKEEWLSPPIDQSDWDREVKPYNWDDKTGLSQRIIPGQLNGQHVQTGLAHDGDSRVAYEAATNQRTMTLRSKKIIAFGKTLKAPEVYGDESADLLVVGWGSTKGAIEEAVDVLRAEGLKVSSVHLRFISPMEAGLKELFSRFKKVMTIEINYSDSAKDPDIPEDHRRYAQLAQVLRNHTLVDIDCWSRVPGGPLPPEDLVEAIKEKYAKMEGSHA